MATVADILDQDLPEGAAEDSTSILPLLAGEKTELPDRPGFINHDGYNRLAIRNGPWKLIAGMAPQLFNLEFDPKESKNLAKTHPKRVTEMQKRPATIKTR
jgi:arylsulfatase A-like enzyme|tara:strand:+ start:52 stop:354 length:303 start_codon:yes stop_codon:yes gene_type:complete